MLKQLLIFDLPSPTRFTLENENVQRLLNSNQTYNLIIIDLMCEALVVLGHHFNAPVIGVSTLGTMEMINLITWNPQPFPYVPSLSLPFSDEMTFLQRTVNTINSITITLLASLAVFPSHAALIKEKFPNAPPFIEMLHNVSLIFLNSHYSIVETPRPYQPNMIPIGGFHVQPQEMAPDLKRFLDNAIEGVVLFSLGSNLQSTELPVDKLDLILKCLEKFPQKFLWKFEDDDFLRLPQNVRVMKWIPQRAVLGKKNHFLH